MKGITGYISIREACYKWGASERRITQYRSAGRIPGPTRFGRFRAIPADAKSQLTRGKTGRRSIRHAENRRL